MAQENKASLQEQLAEYNERTEEHLKMRERCTGFYYPKDTEITLIKGIGLIASILLELSEQIRGER